MDFVGANILSISQFTLDDVTVVCELAQRLEKFARRQHFTTVLQGAVLANLFFEPSTRTRISFGAAFNRLGGAVRDTTGVQSSSLSKGESLIDTSRVVSGYADVIVIRHPEENGVYEFAAKASVPVINGGNGTGEHPTQALLDYYTLRQELGNKSRSIDGMTLAIVGDLRYGRTVHSLVKLLALHSRINFVLAAPPLLGLPDDLHAYLESRGHSITIEDSPSRALASADALYATRLQRERFADQSVDLAQYRNFVINRVLLEEFGRPDVIIMHPLPRDSRVDAIDLSHDLDDDPRLAIFRQTEAGIPIRMALFALVLDVTRQIEYTSKPVRWFVSKRPV